MELGRIEVRETICRPLYRTRLTEVTGEALSVVGFVLSSVWHVRCNIHQSGNRWIRARFCDYGSPIAVRDKDTRSGLRCEDPLHGGHIILGGRLRLLDDADVEAIPDKVVVNALQSELSAQGPWTRTIFFASDFWACKFGVLDRTAVHNTVANTTNRLPLTPYTLRLSFSLGSSSFISISAHLGC
jgi:hypothetical protein